MKDSHGQTTTLSGRSREDWHAHLDKLFEIAIPGENIPFNALHAWPGTITEKDVEWAKIQVAKLARDSHGQTVQQPVGMSMMGMQTTSTTLEICVQDYREYTADEILYGILESTEQAGWGDPANLGHWLGAAQRWAKERV